MKTKRISMERIRELDIIWDRECNAFLQMGEHYDGPSPFFLQERYLDAVNLKAMAKKWKVPLEELRAYVAIQWHINALANGDWDIAQMLDGIADQIGIHPVEFNEYCQKKAKEIQDNRVPDQDGDLAEWRDVTAEDFNDLEEDLLQEAGRRGLCE